ncbi:hypothetical protein L6452_16124 [Arctium lappa]|uniref:Uncharacterized protein n=1 Tax=Arctium lappa TaxID=4217 RepID=A0ACB9BZV1_ARCLA|nr:hypothetical protein L6452_16124 [Arctium lappa]
MSSIFIISLLLVQIYLGGASMEIHQALSHSCRAHKKRTKRGRMCLVLAGDLALRYVASLPTIWSIFSGDLVASICSGDLVLADEREMDVLPIWSMWFHPSLFPPLFCF